MRQDSVMNDVHAGIKYSQGGEQYPSLMANVESEATVPPGGNTSTRSCSVVAVPRVRAVADPVPFCCLQAYSS
jgi:hypothetical protein